MIAAQERRFQTRLEHMRLLARTSISGFFKFLLITPAAQHRKHLTIEAFHLARIAATRAEGCGACVQMAVQMAREERVSERLLAALVSGNYDALNAEQIELVDFAQEVAAGLVPHDLRERVAKRLGEAAMVEVAMAIAFARVFPTYKRALGFGSECEFSSNQTSQVGQNIHENLGNITSA